jgi:predicted HicB family RNase H-like nuclease
VKNVMEIDGVQAVISYDPDIALFRGEFIGLSGGADFYAADVESLRREGQASLRVYLDACREDGAEPFKAYSGKFVLRLSPEDHRAAALAAQAAGLSLNQWAANAVRDAART